MQYKNGIIYGLARRMSPHMHKYKEIIRCLVALDKLSRRHRLIDINHSDVCRLLKLVYKYYKNATNTERCICGNTAALPHIISCIHRAVGGSALESACGAATCVLAGVIKLPSDVVYRHTERKYYGSGQCCARDAYMYEL
jgi:hypothetical protein